MYFDLTSYKDILCVRVQKIFWEKFMTRILFLYNPFFVITNMFLSNIEQTLFQIFLLIDSSKSLTLQVVVLPDTTDKTFWVSCSLSTTLTDIIILNRTIWSHTNTYIITPECRDTFVSSFNKTEKVYSFEICKRSPIPNSILNLWVHKNKKKSILWVSMCDRLEKKMKVNKKLPLTRTLHRGSGRLGVKWLICTRTGVSGVDIFSPNLR